jgi:hypothetical protein
MSSEAVVQTHDLQRIVAPMQVILRKSAQRYLSRPQSLVRGSGSRRSASTKNASRHAPLFSCIRSPFGHRWTSGSGRNIAVERHHGADAERIEQRAASNGRSRGRTVGRVHRL